MAKNEIRTRLAISGQRDSQLTTGEAASLFSTLSDDRPIVVLAPHPGDETLGCGMLLAAAFATRGARVVSLSPGTDRGSSSASSSSGGVARRAAELDAAIRTLGGRSHDVERWGLPAGRVPTGGATFERAVRWVEALCVSAGARCLYASGPENTHVDHLAAALLAQRVAERRPELRVLHYTLWPRADDQADSAHSSPQEAYRFGPERWRKVKRRAVQCYRSQLEELEAAPRGAELRRMLMQCVIENGERFVEPSR